MTKNPDRNLASRRGLGLGWKTGILAASLSAVLLGCTTLPKTNTAEPVQSAIPTSGVAPVPGSTLAAPPSPSSSLRPRTMPSMPNRPTFRQPLTRSRAS